MSESGENQPEEVHVDKQVDSQVTRTAHICTLCHTQLHKICSTDANISIIAVTREGKPAGWGTGAESSTSKVGDSGKSGTSSQDSTGSPDSSKVLAKSSSKGSKGSVDKDRKKSSIDANKPTSWGSGTGSHGSAGSSSDSSLEAKGNKGWKKALDEEEERKRKKKWEEEERRRKQQAKTTESTLKPSHDEFEKKRKKDW